MSFLLRAMTMSALRCLSTAPRVESWLLLAVIGQGSGHGDSVSKLHRPITSRHTPGRLRLLAGWPTSSGRHTANLTV